MTTTECISRVTSPKRNDTILSPYSNEQAAEICKDGGNQFAFGLAKKWEQYGRRLSPECRYWLHKLASEIKGVSTGQQPHGTVVTSGTHAAIAALFASSRESGLKFPKLHVQWAGRQYKIMVAGERSRNAGSINVVSEGGYHDSTYYGRLSDEDRFVDARDTTPEHVEQIVPMLEALAADPVAFATTHGHETGACCFCNTELTHANSIEVGYGPICAGRWGLPHTYA